MNVWLRCLAPLVLSVCLCCERALAIEPVTATWPELIASARKQARTDPLDRKHLLPGSQPSGVALAPVGGHVAMLIGKPTARTLAVLAPAATEPTPLLAATDTTALSWSQDGRHLLLVSERHFALWSLHERRSRVLLRRHPRVRDSLLGSDPSQAAAWLMLRQTAPLGAVPAPRYQLVRLSADAEPQVIHDSSEAYFDALIDRQGQPVLRWRAERGAHVIESIGQQRAPRVIARCPDLRECVPLDTVVTEHGAWLRSSIEGDFLALQRLAPDGTLHHVHEDPATRSDLDDVVFEGRTRLPRIAHYRSVVATAHALDAKTAPLLARLVSKLGDADLKIQIASLREPWLVAARSSQDAHPRWSRFDPVHDTLTPLTLLDPKERVTPTPALPRHTVPRHAVRWRASDGRWLYGFVSLPSGVDLSRAPLVALVHGGPWSHVAAGWSGTAQFLASRGSIVFEPNFRGSTGLGRTTMITGGQDFANGRVQADIDEGVAALLDRGIGRADRCAILGASFGGYASLLAATGPSSRYRTAIAMVPPPDLAWVLRWATRSSDAALATDIPIADSLEALGLPLGDLRLYQRLADISPRARVQSMDVPVLIMAGGQDARVPIRSVLDYAAHLSLAKKPFQLYVDPQGDHGLAQEQSRELVLYQIEAWLAHYLDLPPPTPLTAADQTLLNKRLVIAIGRDGLPARAQP